MLPDFLDGFEFFDIVLILVLGTLFVWPFLA